MLKCVVLARTSIHNGKSGASNLAIRCMLVDQHGRSELHDAPALGVFSSTSTIRSIVLMCEVPSEPRKRGLGAHDAANYLVKQFFNCQKATYVHNCSPVR